MLVDHRVQSTKACGPQIPLCKGLWTTESKLQRPVDQRDYTKRPVDQSPLYKSLWTKEPTLQRLLDQRVHSTEACGPQSPLYRDLWTKESTLERTVDQKVHFSVACGPRSPLYRGLWTTISTLKRSKGLWTMQHSCHLETKDQPGSIQEKSGYYIFVILVIYQCAIIFSR